MALLAALSYGQRVDLQPTCDGKVTEARQANREALDVHLKRQLDEASGAYKRVLSADPPRAPSEAELKLVLRFAPRVFATASEPFGLRDAAAVIHPKAPWIAYHFFWEDDIDFPDDNDPCDHELMWVRLDERRERVVDYFTYFHGRILRALPAALEEANRSGGQPAVRVQWGKHGTMPAGWRNLTIVADNGDTESDYYPLDREISLEKYSRGTFEKLSRVGPRAASSPLAGKWPKRFSGTWEDFLDFSKPVDVRGILRRKKMVLVSSWNNSVLDRYLLRYNFRPKTEWPPQVCEDLNKDGGLPGPYSPRSSL